MLGDELIGIFNWAVSSLIPLLGIFAILTIALNVQWGYAGIINFGVVAFFMVGAYTSAILTLPPPGSFESYIGGWGLPIVVGWIGGALAAVVLALLVALPVLRLKEDFLAITTIGVAEILRSVALSTPGFLNRGEGLRSISRPLADVTSDPDIYRWVILGIIVAVILLVIFVVWAMGASPWGRVLRSVRDNERTTLSSGKSLFSYKLQSFVFGAAIMGLAGAIYAHYLRAIAPDGFTDLYGTFLVWTMLIVGGSGRIGGALLGTVLIGTIWFGANLAQSYIPDSVVNVFAGVVGAISGEESTAGARSQFVVALRQLLIGGLIILFVVFRPQGLIPEQPKVSRFIKKKWAALKVKAS